MAAVSTSPTAAAAATAAAVVVATVGYWLVAEQRSIARKSRGIPGPSLPMIPFFGSIFKVVSNPFDFYAKQEAMGQLFLLDNARPLFTIPYLDASTHMRIRKSALPLFAPGALTSYITGWEREMRETIESWVAAASTGSDDMKGTEYEALAPKLPAGAGVLHMRTRLHIMTMNASVQALVGVRNLPAGVTVEIFAAEYSKLNAGLLSLPVNLPGTPLNAAIKARKTLSVWLHDAVASSRDRINRGEEPESVLDQWIFSLKQLEEDPSRRSAKQQPVSDQEVTDIILDFFFAAQDATVSGMTSLYHVLGDFPDAVRKLVDEHVELRGPRLEKPLTTDMIQHELQYTRRGTIVIPSILHGSRNTAIDETFDRFDPDRLNPPTGPYSDKPYWTFGAGKHLCLGKDYAVSQLVLHLSLMIERHVLGGFHFQRCATPDDHVDIFGPSVFPKDGAYFVW
ncbi:RNA polymerase C-22 sterol desaturase, partial [Cladochytrium tenue]